MLGEQNPVEDIWLQAKTWVRKFGNRIGSFSLVKWFFNFTIQQQIFDFPKLHKFGDFEPKFSWNYCSIKPSIDLWMICDRYIMYAIAFAWLVRNHVIIVHWIWYSLLYPPEWVSVTLYLIFPRKAIDHMAMTRMSLSRWRLVRFTMRVGYVVKITWQAPL